jgi:hypothetical protein
VDHQAREPLPALPGKRRRLIEFDREPGRGPIAYWRERGASGLKDVVAGWRAAPRTSPGGQAHYSDLAIETALMVRLIFHQPLRHTEGLLGSLLELLGLELPVPDHTTISLRSANLTPVLWAALPDGLVHLVINR